MEHIENRAVGCTGSIVEAHIVAKASIEAEAGILLRINSKIQHCSQNTNKY